MTTTYSESRVLPYTADRMYAIVADVERYPEFLPWVTSLRVLAREREGGREALRAEMLVGFRTLRERYTSRVLLDPVGHTVDVVQVKGPFHILENHWRFTPEGERCRVDFSIAFEFRSRLLQAVAGEAFGHVLRRMTDAFEARAGAISP